VRFESEEYDQQAVLRKVCYRGFIKYRNTKIRIGKALVGEYVAVQPHTKDSFAIFFRRKQLAEIKYDTVKDVS
jgi:hypothetical protein